MPYLGAVTRVPRHGHRLRAPGTRLQPADRVAVAGPRRRTIANIAWARETFEALRPYMASWRYVNNLPADDGRPGRAHIWGTNYERLVQDQAAATTRATSSGSTTTSIRRGQPAAVRSLASRSRSRTARRGRDQPAQLLAVVLPVDPVLRSGLGFGLAGVRGQGGPLDGARGRGVRTQVDVPAAAGGARHAGQGRDAGLFGGGGDRPGHRGVVRIGSGSRPAARQAR